MINISPGNIEMRQATEFGFADPIREEKKGDGSKRKRK